MEMLMENVAAVVQVSLILTNHIMTGSTECRKPWRRGMARNLFNCSKMLLKVFLNVFMTSAESIIHVFSVVKSEKLVTTVLQASGGSYWLDVAQIKVIQGSHLHQHFAKVWVNLQDDTNHQAIVRNALGDIRRWNRHSRLGPVKWQRESLDGFCGGGP